jgi:hypothetical protein
MPTKTNEAALESLIEKALTGRCIEELKTEGLIVEEPDVHYQSAKGYYIGLPEDFSAKYAIDEHRFWHFLETTQQEELSKLQKQSDWKLKILERLDRLIKKYGILRLLRKGLEVDDAHFMLFYELPLASSSNSIKEKFVNLAKSMQAHPDFEEKYANNPDAQNREIAFLKMFEEVMAKQRKNELDLYRLISNDDAFKYAMQDTLKRILRV